MKRIAFVIIICILTPISYVYAERSHLGQSLTDSGVTGSGNISVSGNVISDSATPTFTSVGTGTVTATGNIGAANVIATGAVNSVSMTATGTLNAANMISAGAVNSVNFRYTGIINAPDGTTTAPAIVWTSDDVKVHGFWFDESIDALSYSYQGVTQMNISSVLQGYQTGSSYLRFFSPADATPTYAYVGDTNTGMRRTAVDTQAIITNSTQRLTFGPNGGITHQVLYDDVPVPFLTARVPGAEPSLDAFIGNTVAICFDNTGNDPAYITVQFPHRKKLDTAAALHIHHVPSTTGTGNVTWTAECTSATSYGNAFAATTLIFNGTTAMDGTARKHYITALQNGGADLSTTGQGLSAIYTCAITRSGSYAGNACALSADPHIQIDRPGTVSTTSQTPL